MMWRKMATLKGSVASGDGAHHLLSSTEIELEILSWPRKFRFLVVLFVSLFPIARNSLSTLRSWTRITSHLSAMRWSPSEFFCNASPLGPRVPNWASCGFFSCVLSRSYGDFLWFNFSHYLTTHMQCSSRILVI